MGEMDSSSEWNRVTVDVFSDADGMDDQVRSAVKRKVIDLTMDSDETLSARTTSDFEQKKLELRERLLRHRAHKLMDVFKSNLNTAKQGQHSTKDLHSALAAPVENKPEELNLSSKGTEEICEDSGLKATPSYNSRPKKRLK